MIILSKLRALSNSRVAVLHELVSLISAKQRLLNEQHLIRDANAQLLNDQKLIIAMNDHLLNDQRQIKAKNDHLLIERREISETNTRMSRDQLQMQGLVEYRHREHDWLANGGSINGLLPKNLPQGLMSNVDMAAIIELAKKFRPAAPSWISVR